MVNTVRRALRPVRMELNPLSVLIRWSRLLVRVRVLSHQAL
jgi:hypothetical protein